MEEKKPAETNKSQSKASGAPDTDATASREGKPAYEPPELMKFEEALEKLIVSGE